MTYKNRIWFLKGITMFEMQIGRLIINIVHLNGGCFTWWAFWRRFTFKWATETKYNLEGEANGG